MLTNQLILNKRNLMKTFISFIHENDPLQVSETNSHLTKSGGDAPYTSITYKNFVGQ